MIARTAGLSVAPAGPGCVTMTAAGRTGALVLAPASAPVLLTMSRQEPGELTGHLAGDRSQFPGVLAPVGLGGRTRYLIAARGVRATLALPGGRTRVCGVAAAG